MYNGIGLTTARGSGTNGFVQRNLSTLPNKQKRVEYKSEDELKHLEGETFRGPNLEILKHARKRQIELKCLEMRELMEEQNYTEEEIEQKVSKFRKMLFEKESASEGTKVVLEKDEFGRPIAKDSHEIAQAQAEKNRRFREALGIPDNYVDGSSLNNLRVKEEEKKVEPKYALIDEPNDIPSSSAIPALPAEKSDAEEQDVEHDSESTSGKKKNKHKKKKSKPERRETTDDSEREEDDLEDRRSRSRSPSPPKHKHHHRHEDRHGKHSKRHEDRSRSRSRSHSGEKKQHGRHHRKDDDR